jgi:F-type H+-transporting ATPase subunit b
MTFNGWTFLFEALNFVVLAYLLHRLLYRPLRDAVDQRRAVTARAQAEAKTARQDAEALQQQLQTRLAELEQQRQEAMHQAREQAESDRRRLLAETEQVIRQRQEESRQTLERERTDALEALRTEVTTQAIDLTRRLLREAADQTLHRQLVLRLVQTLTELPETECARLRAQCQTDGEALLETARDLDATALELVKQAVAAVAGKPVALTVQSKPVLLDGVRLRLGGCAWDASLAGQLPDATRITTQDVPS